MERKDISKIRNQLFQSQPSYELIKCLREEKTIELRKKKRIQYTNNQRNFESLNTFYFKFSMECFPEELLKKNEVLTSLNTPSSENLKKLLNFPLNFPDSIAPASNMIHLCLENKKYSLKISMIDVNISTGLLKNIVPVSEILRITTLKII
jgi:hypothetical protein